jgi:hypothetical protein
MNAIEHIFSDSENPDSIAVKNNMLPALPGGEEE